MKSDNLTSKANPERTNSENERKKLEKKVQRAKIRFTISIILLTIGVLLVLLWVNFLQLAIGITLVIVPLLDILDYLVHYRKTQKEIERMKNL